MSIYKDIVSKVLVPADKKTKQKAYKKYGRLPIVDQGQSLIGGYSDDDSKELNCVKPVIIFGDHTCVVKYISFPFGVGADGVKVLKPKEGILPKYLYYGTQYLVLKLQDRGYARHYQHIEKMDLPVFSIQEQENIVAKLEETFSQIDEGIKNLKKTKEQIEIYRQSVLVSVFKEVSHKMETIENLCENIVDCPHSTPKWSEEGRLCLRTSNFKRGYLDLSEKNYVTSEVYDERTARLIPKPGDVLYSREGSILGIACIIPKGIEPCLGQRMMLFRTGEKINNLFLMHYLNSPIVTNHVIVSKGGTGSPHINVGDIKKFRIPLVSYDNQLNVVKYIDEKLSVCNQIDKTIDNAMFQAEALRQSVLKKAFEGRLV